MQSSPGLCRNLAECELARSGQLVSVPLYDAFVCPSCGAQLASPPLPVKPPDRSRRIVLATLLLACLGVGAAAWWKTRSAVIGLAPVALRAPSPTVETATLAPVPEADVAASATPQPNVADAPKVVAAATAGSAPPASVAPASASAPPDGRFNPVPLAGGAPAYPAAADGRPGSVQVNCTILPNGTPRGCTAKPIRGGKLFPPAVLAWLAQKPQFRPVTRHGHPVAERAHWRVAVEQGPQAPRAANPPAKINQPSSLLAVDSSHPVFPDQYYESDWMGHVTVDCLIGADGQATGCREKAREGSNRFADAVLAWLADPHTRFQPATSQGHPVPARRVWQVGFTP